MLLGIIVLGLLIAISVALIRMSENTKGVGQQRPTPFCIIN